MSSREKVINQTGTKKVVKKVKKVKKIIKQQTAPTKVIVSEDVEFETKDKPVKKVIKKKVKKVKRLIQTVNVIDQSSQNEILKPKLPKLEDPMDKSPKIEAQTIEAVKTESANVDNIGNEIHSIEQNMINVQSTELKICREELLRCYSILMKFNGMKTIDNDFFRFEIKTVGSMFS